MPVKFLSGLLNLNPCINGLSRATHSILIVSELRNSVSFEGLDLKLYKREKEKNINCNRITGNFQCPFW